MQIQWFGQSYFKIQTKSNNNADLTIALDPYQDEIGLKAPKFQADIVTISHDHYDHNNLDAIKGEPFVINKPGEYEVKGAFIYGIPSWHDDQKGKKSGSNLICRFNVEGINLAHLGDLGSELNDEQLEKLGNIDILLIPVGGGPTIDAKIANKIISEIEPRIIIPMHYQIPGLKVKLNGVEEFLKISGLPQEKTDKFKIIQKNLPPEGAKIILLTL